jgi:hypothetical protein
MPHGRPGPDARCRAKTSIRTAKHRLFDLAASIAARLIRPIFTGLCTSERICPDANRGFPLLGWYRRPVCAPSKDFLEGAAGPVEAGFRHRSHFLASMAHREHLIGTFFNSGARRQRDCGCMAEG